MPATSTDRLYGMTTSVAVKPPCVVATTVPITLSGEQTINSISVLSGQRVLVNAQTDLTQNGIWVANTSAWSRAPDFDGSLDAVNGTLVLVQNAVNPASFYELEAVDPVYIGTSNLTFNEKIIDVEPTAFGQQLIEAADAAEAQQILGLEIGVDVQPYDADIATQAATQAEMEAGTESGLRSMSPELVKQAIDALGGATVSVQGASKNLKASASGTSATINISTDEIVVENAAGAYFTLRDVAVAASLAASGANGLDDSVPTVVTMTIASPGLITETAHGRPANAPVVLATTGALPTGYTAGTTYYVTNPTVNGYSLSATKGGAAINTTGSQSGVHTVKSVLAVSSWYSKWVIWNGTTKAALLSSSETNPVLPSGYTHKARTGWAYTDNSGNKFPFAFDQDGDCVQYTVKAGSNVLALPTLVSGVQGNVSTPTWVAAAVANFVPPTASRIALVLSIQTANACMAAPNNSYGAYTSTTNPPPLVISAGTLDVKTAEFSLESTDVYFAANAATGRLQCLGWRDNL